MSAEGNPTQSPMPRPESDAAAKFDSGLTDVGDGSSGCGCWAEQQLSEEIKNTKDAARYGMQLLASNEALKEELAKLRAQLQQKATTIIPADNDSRQSDALSVSSLSASHNHSSLVVSAVSAKDQDSLINQLSFDLAALRQRLVDKERMFEEYDREHDHTTRVHQLAIEQLKQQHKHDMGHKVSDLQQQLSLVSAELDDCRGQLAAVQSQNDGLQLAAQRNRLMDDSLDASTTSNPDDVKVLLDQTLQKLSSVTQQLQEQQQTEQVLKADVQSLHMQLQSAQKTAEDNTELYERYKSMYEAEHVKADELQFEVHNLAVNARKPKGNSMFSELDDQRLKVEKEAIELRKQADICQAENKRLKMDLERVHFELLNARRPAPQPQRQRIDSFELAGVHKELSKLRSELNEAHALTDKYRMMCEETERRMSHQSSFADNGKGLSRTETMLRDTLLIEREQLRKTETKLSDLARCCAQRTDEKLMAIRKVDQLKKEVDQLKGELHFKTLAVDQLKFEQRNEQSHVHVGSRASQPVMTVTNTEDFTHLLQPTNTVVPVSASECTLTNAVEQDMSLCTVVDAPSVPRASANPSASRSVSYAPNVQTYDECTGQAAVVPMQSDDNNNAPLKRVRPKNMRFATPKTVTRVGSGNGPRAHTVLAKGGQPVSSVQYTVNVKGDPLKDAEGAKVDAGGEGNEVQAEAGETKENKAPEEIA